MAITKTLKLLYLIDETAVRETGVPVTWLEYKVWEMGPVAIEVYEELRHLRNPSLARFIQVERKHATDFETTIIRPATHFDDSEFSEYEIDLMARIVNKYGYLSAKNLIDLLHTEGTLWHKNVIRNELQLAFSVYNKRSNVAIEPTDLIADYDLKLAAFKAAVDALEFQTQLNLH